MAELYDIVAANQRATQVGTQLGSVMANNSLRMQELQSKRALEQLQQQQAAETLSWTLRQHQMAIQQQADTQKANSEFMAMRSPTINLPVQGATEDGSSMGVAEVPNPHYVQNEGEAILKAYSGLARTPQEQTKLLLDAATVNYHNAQAANVGQPRLRTPEQIEADKALTAQRQSGVDLNKQRIEESKARMMKTIKGDAYAPGPLEKDLDAIDKEESLSPEERTRAKHMRIGLEPKPSTRKDFPTKQAYIDKHINPFLSNNQGVKRQDAIKELSAEYDGLAQAIGSAVPAANTPRVRRYNPNTGKLE